MSTLKILQGRVPFHITMNGSIHTEKSMSKDISGMKNVFISLSVVKYTLKCGLIVV